MNRKKSKDSDKKGFFAEAAENAGKYISKNWQILILFGITFLISVFLAFLKTTATNTVASFNIDEYQVGQIADINIIANKSLPATDVDPAVEKGEKVVSKGFPITEEQYLKMDNMAHSKSYIDGRTFADFTIFLMLVSALYFFLYSPHCLGKAAPFKELVMEAVLFLVVFGVTGVCSTTAVFSSAYNLCGVIPACLCVFLISTMFGHLDAVFYSLILSFSVLCASGFQLVTFLYTLTTCLISVGIVFKIEKRMDMVVAALLQAVLNVIVMAVFKVIFNDSFRGSAWLFIGVAANGFLSGILTLGFLTPLEYILNTATVFRLMDLSDQQSDEMKRLELEARGTYEHSRMVGRLAESACREIGANALLARVGGYYHDIGKMEHPEYFTENSINGENIHRDLQLNPSLSISMIKSHVKQGVERAQELHLPKEVIDIIAEHHGNQVIEFFYNEALKKDPDAKPEDYSYNGNIPSSRESAVVLLADTVEAACRSYCSGLEKPTAPQLEKFIQGLINKKFETHQLDNANLTFADLTKIRETFVHILAGYYHTRIKYQNQKNPEDENAEERQKNGTVYKEGEAASNNGRTFYREGDASRGDSTRTEIKNSGNGSFTSESNSKTQEAVKTDKADASKSEKKEKTEKPEGEKSVKAEKSDRTIYREGKAVKAEAAKSEVKTSRTVDAEKTQAVKKSAKAETAKTTKDNK